MRREAERRQARARLRRSNGRARRRAVRGEIHRARVIAGELAKRWSTTSAAIAPRVMLRPIHASAPGGSAPRGSGSGCESRSFRGGKEALTAIRAEASARARRGAIEARPGRRRSESRVASERSWKRLDALCADVARKAIHGTTTVMTRASGPSSCEAYFNDRGWVFASRRASSRSISLDRAPLGVTLVGGVFGWSNDSRGRRRGRRQPTKELRRTCIVRDAGVDDRGSKRSRSRWSAGAHRVHDRYRRR